jgi:hypothetical protein
MTAMARIDKTTPVDKKKFATNAPGDKILNNVPLNVITIEMISTMTPLFIVIMVFYFS